VSLGFPRFRLPGGRHFITSFGNLPTSILWTCPYHWSCFVLTSGTQWNCRKSSNCLIPGVLGRYVWSQCEDWMHYSAASGIHRTNTRHVCCPVCLTWRCLCWIIWRFFVKVRIKMWRCLPWQCVGLSTVCCTLPLRRLASSQSLLQAPLSEETSLRLGSLFYKRIWCHVCLTLQPVCLCLTLQLVCICLTLQPICLCLTLQPVCLCLTLQDVCLSDLRACLCLALQPVCLCLILQRECVSSNLSYRNLCTCDFRQTSCLSVCPHLTIQDQLNGFFSIKFQYLSTYQAIG
jgi:hypothetical protein